LWRLATPDAPIIDFAKDWFDEVGGHFHLIVSAIRLYNAAADPIWRR
jgi:hypothetical protein